MQEAKHRQHILITKLFGAGARDWAGECLVLRDRLYAGCEGIEKRCDTYRTVHVPSV